MILTRRSLWNFIALDALIFVTAVKIISLVLNGLYLTTFDNTKFNLMKITILVILAILFQLCSTNLIVDSRRKKEISRVYEIIFIIAIALATALQFYQGMYWVK